MCNQAIDSRCCDAVVLCMRCIGSCWLVNDAKWNWSSATKHISHSFAHNFFFHRFLLFRTVRWVVKTKFFFWFVCLLPVCVYGSTRGIFLCINSDAIFQHFVAQRNVMDVADFVFASSIWWLLLLAYRLGHIFYSSTIFWNHIAHTMDNLHFYRHFMKSLHVSVSRIFVVAFLCSSSTACYRFGHLHVVSSRPVNKYCVAIWYPASKHCITYELCASVA